MATTNHQDLRRKQIVEDALPDEGEDLPRSRAERAEREEREEREERAERERGGEGGRVVRG